MAGAGTASSGSLRDVELEQQVLSQECKNYGIMMCLKQKLRNSSWKDSCRDGELSCREKPSLWSTKSK